MTKASLFVTGFAAGIMHESPSLAPSDICRAAFGGLIVYLIWRAMDWLFGESH
jgi:hypothetical protein